MTELFDSDGRHFEVLPRYVFAEDLLRRRRVLDLECGDGTGSNFAVELEARAVVGVDSDPDRVAGANDELGGGALEFQHWEPPTLDFPDNSFDMVLALRGVGSLGEDPSATLREIRRVLAPDGYLYLASANPDRRTIPDVLAQEEPGADEPGYYDLYELLTEAFPEVRMIGQSPFMGFSLVEFSPEDPDELAMSMDDSLLQETEDATTFLALCGERPPPPLDFSLIQLPYFDLMSYIESFVGDGEDEGVEAPATEASTGDPATREQATRRDGKPISAVMTDELAARLEAARGSAEVRRARGRNRSFRKTHARLMESAKRAAARTRRAAVIAAEATARAREAAAAEQAARARLGEVQKILEQLKLAKLGVEAESRKELKEREDRISELLQKLVKKDSKVQRLEAEIVDKDFALGNAKRERGAEVREEVRSAPDRDRELEGLRAALVEARSAPQRRIEESAAVQERERRIAELSAELQAMEWRVEEAVGETARLQGELARRERSSAA